MRDTEMPKSTLEHYTHTGQQWQHRNTGTFPKTPIQDIQNTSEWVPSWPRGTWINFSSLDIPNLNPLPKSQFSLDNSAFNKRQGRASLSKQ